MPIIRRIQRVLNAFSLSEVNRPNQSYNMGPDTSNRPDRPQIRFYNDKSLIASIYTRIAIDVAGIDIRHVKLDEKDRYSKDMDSTLNGCLKFQPNIDQGPRAFRQDICMTLFDKGVVAVVPVDTLISGSVEDDDLRLDILTMRVGEIVGWYPKHVRVSLYNEASGTREEIVVEKRAVAIIENPLYAVMNAPNSTLQRLIRKLHLLDVVDEQSSSGKLDLIIQLPYVIKSEARREQAEKRRADIEFQLKGSQYGIAYTDGTEKVTQLNRPAENNLFKQVEYLFTMLYGQLGITEDIMNGTASEATMINYYNRTIEPILDGCVQAMQRSLLGSKGTMADERIQYFRNPFKLIPIGQIAEIADKFTRNEIFTSNEIRGFMGVEPSSDPKADQLVNSNMPQKQAIPPGPSSEDVESSKPPTFKELKGKPQNES